MSIEKRTYGTKVLAIILRNDFNKEGVNFISPEEYPLQMGVHLRKQGESVEAHIHKPFKNISEIISQEIFYVVYGKVQVDLFESGKKVDSCILRGGDTILLAFSGHGVKFLEDTKMVEIKQGPYRGIKKEKEFI